jgi:hypothetical protein
LGLLGCTGQRHDPTVSADERVDQPGLAGPGLHLGSGGHLAIS